MTKYYYPTWADILGEQWEYSENWGKPGQGNQYIFHSILECLSRNDFTKNDTIMILWTGISRTDYRQLGHWRAKSGFFSQDPNIITHCPEGFELTNYGLFYAVHEILKAKNIQFKSMTWCTYYVDSEPGKLYENTIYSIKKFKFAFNKKFIPRYSSLNFAPTFQNLYDSMAGKDWPSLQQILSDDYVCTSDFIQQEIKNFLKHLNQHNKEAILVCDEVDEHPLPREHLRISRLMCPDIEINGTTVDFINQFDENLQNNHVIHWQSKNPPMRMSV